MRRTLLLGAVGLFIVALGFAVDRARAKPEVKPLRRLLIIASESPQSVADQSPSTVAVPVPKSNVLSERQAALKLILEDFRSEQERAAKRGQSVEHELNVATAKLFIQLSHDSSSENVVKLLAEMTDQQAAKVLAEIKLTDEELAESLTEKLAVLKP